MHILLQQLYSQFLLQALKLQKLTPLTDPRYRNNTNVDGEEPPDIKHNSNENMKYLYIWLIEICLRIPGTIRYIMAAHKRHTGYSSAYDSVDVYFLHFQSFGDSAQAFCTWVVFCGPKLKRMVTSRVCRHHRKGEEKRMLIVQKYQHKFISFLSNQQLVWCIQKGKTVNFISHFVCMLYIFQFNTLYMKTLLTPL